MLEASLIEDEGGGASLPVEGAEVGTFVFADSVLVLVAVVRETKECDAVVVTN